MPATIILGGQWGDEGKGKLTDALAAEAAVVVRANGGSNAGHTLETSAGVFQLHLVPSGILNPDCLCVVGAGVVVDPGALLAEMDALRARGVSVANLRISDRAHVVLPYHPTLDRLEETRRAAVPIGTTGRGIGPAYADKVGRHGVRVADLVDEATLRRRLTVEVAAKNEILGRVYGEPPLDLEEVVRRYADYGVRLREHVAPTETLVQDALAARREVLIECAQGAMLDVDYGTYPFVTSSSPTAAGACQGAGVAPTQVRRVVAVFKAYSTRVGAGPLPTELHDGVAAGIRERGREYGTTTGRPRRIGWFDAVAAAHVARLNGATEVALTLLDVLDAMPEIRVCTGYTLDGQVIDRLPARDDELARVVPVLTTLPGWETPTTGARRAEDLPAAARAYVRFLEQAIGAPVTLVGVGPSRQQLVPLGLPLADPVRKGMATPAA
ncbi:MAG: Adenylosuccinate synthetase [uncultured Thermomicrobiales bacterium]|uniref:Adenylosuccinate synthetase n=1 Tax=uncultured Thermomicrobiales bacterium TaxID=1645740 RepID=A0A6J4UA87_9BACT|nr:MAG: Adenylosuccinate synthetase [uncultured Thermomicrobiales bacterium]